MGKNLVCHQPVGSTGVGGNSGDPFTEWCDQLMNRSIGRYRPIGAFIAAIATIVVDDRPMHKLVTAFAEYYAAENPNVFQRAIPPPIAHSCFPEEASRCQQVSNNFTRSSHCVNFVSTGVIVEKSLFEH